MEQGLPGQVHRKPVLFLRQQQAAALLPHLVSREDQQQFANRRPAFPNAQSYCQARYLPGSRERIPAPTTEQGSPSKPHRKPEFSLR